MLSHAENILFTDRRQDLPASRKVLWVISDRLLNGGVVAWNSISAKTTRAFSVQPPQWLDAASWLTKDKQTYSIISLH